MAPSQHPDLTSVLRAVTDFTGEASKRGSAQAALGEWGESALPFLEEIARGAHDQKIDHGIVFALCALDSRRALALFVEILSGKTAVRTEAAVSATPMILHEPSRLRRLEADPAFKTAIDELVSSDSYLARSAYANVAAALGWPDSVATIRKMLDDEHLSVREAAAEALTALTGEEVQAKRPAAVFPAREVQEGRLSGPRPLEGIRRKGSVPRVVNLGGDGDVRLVVPMSDRLSFGPTCAVCFGASGEELWSYQAPHAMLNGMAPLWSESCAYGVALAVGGATGIVALDADGDVLWDVPNQHVAYGVRSHRELPGLLLHVGGNLLLLEHSPSGAKKMDLGPFGLGTESEESAIYATDALLFPGESEEPACIVVGTGAAPSMMRIDASPERRWKSVLPGDPAGLALVESQDGSRAIAVATREGDLFLVDTAGTLLWEGTVPGGGGGQETSVTRVDAVEVDGKPSIVVHTIPGSFSYELSRTHR